MADYLRTLFLHPPSFRGFDGGAGARYQARREIRSFWYPTWLAQPAALVPDSRLVDAPPAGLSYRVNGHFERTAERPPLENMDALPFVVDVYRRDLVVEQYFIGYLLHPYVSLYTGRGCRSRCTFCLWPQTVGGHRYRTRSV